MKIWVILLLFCVAQVSWVQNKEPSANQTAIKDFLGIWEAFQEGDPPDTAKREEASKLIILQDAKGRLLVVVATRYADRQIRFLYGVAHLTKAGLSFTDEKGFNYKITIGRNGYGRFLGVKPDILRAETEVGSFRRIEIQ